MNEIVFWILLVIYEIFIQTNWDYNLVDNKGSTLAVQH